MVCQSVVMLFNEDIYLLTVWLKVCWLKQPAPQVWMNYQVPDAMEPSAQAVVHGGPYDASVSEIMYPEIN